MWRCLLAPRSGRRVSPCHMGRIPLRARRFLGILTQSRARAVGCGLPQAETPSWKSTAITLHPARCRPTLGSYSGLLIFRPKPRILSPPSICSGPSTMRATTANSPSNILRTMPAKVIPPPPLGATLPSPNPRRCCRPPPISPRAARFLCPRLWPAKAASMLPSNWRRPAPPPLRGGAWTSSNFSPPVCRSSPLWPTPPRSMKARPQSERSPFPRRL